MFTILETVFEITEVGDILTVVVDLMIEFTILEYAPLPECFTIGADITSVNSVLIIPGSKMTTLILKEANSSLKQSLQPSKACLVA